MVLASTDAVYGEMNPFRDVAVARAWNTVEMNFLTLVLSPLPKILTSIFIHKVIQARETVVAAFLDYIKKGGTKTASALWQTKHAHHREKFSDDGVARTDIAMSFAILGNTNPAAWWLIYHIFSDPVVLNDVRGELLSAPGLVTYTGTEPNELQKDEEQKLQVECVIDLALLRTHCPILLSTLQETLRHRTVSNSVRKVLQQDILLDGRYLLKQGSLVMLPHAVQHTSIKAFGKDAREFDHSRFVRGRQDRRTFYAFGGGHTMCPGRHFATMEIMALAAVMALRFDIETIGVTTEKGKGKWVEPSCENSPMASGLPYPDDETFVRVRERDWSVAEGKKKNIIKWRVCYSGSESETTLDIGAERVEHVME